MRVLSSKEFYRLVDIIQETDWYVDLDKSNEEEVLIKFSDGMDNEGQFSCSREDFNEASDYINGIE